MKLRTNGFEEIPEVCKHCSNFICADLNDGLYWIQCNGVTDGDTSECRKLEEWQEKKEEV